MSHSTEPADPSDALDLVDLTDALDLEALTPEQREWAEQARRRVDNRDRLKRQKEIE